LVYDAQQTMALAEICTYENALPDCLYKTKYFC